MAATTRLPALAAHAAIDGETASSRPPRARPRRARVLGKAARGVPEGGMTLRGSEGVMAGAVLEGHERGEGNRPL